MKTWEVWCEGYAATGERGDAHSFGKYEAESFMDACLLAMKKDNRMDYFSISKTGGVPMFWGCCLYDNETDARRRFG